MCMYVCVCMYVYCIIILTKTFNPSKKLFNVHLIVSHIIKKLEDAYNSFVYNIRYIFQGSPQNSRVEWCLSKDQRNFEVLLHSSYHIKGKRLTSIPHSR